MTSRHDNTARLSEPDDREPIARAPSRERILFVAREFTLGGAAYLAVRHMRRLQSRYDIDLLVTGPCDTAMLSQLPAQVSVFRLDAGSLKADADALTCLEQVLKQRHRLPFQRAYQAVLATSVFPSWYACLVVSLVRARRRLVFMVDESLARYPRLRFSEQSAIDCSLLAADLVLPVSERLWLRMGACCPMLARRPWHVLRPPVDRQEIRRQLQGVRPDCGPRDNPVVLTVARLSADKQILQQLRVHHRLRQAGLEFRWYVVGSGPEEARLRAEIRRLDMADAFFLVGHQDNVHAWMKQCDVFALLSSSEGFPTVLIEAALAGCAIMVTDVNGADELIDSGRTGLIVANDAAAIEQGLVRLLRDPDLRNRFRSSLAEEVAGHDVDRDSDWLMERIEEPLAVAAEPKVSILIPTYNHERYIDQAIASALMQDFPFLEVIVSDDASTDQTELRARTWTSDPRLRYCRNDRNLGRVANYRKALTEHARGEWVLLLDGDDHLTDPGFIRHAWDALQRHADRSPLFAQAGHQVHHVQGNQPDTDVLPDIDRPERLMRGGDYLQFVYETGFFTHLGTLYNRRAAIEHGFYTADISSTDMDSLLRLALEGEVLVLNTLAGRWVQHGDNASSNLPLDEIAANVRIFRQIAKQAVQRRLTSMPRIEGALTRYEAHTLAYLFGQTVGKSAHGPVAALRMWRVASSVNPRLLLSPRLVFSGVRNLAALTRLAIKRRVGIVLDRFGIAERS